MEKNFLITASLVNSVAWLQDCPSSWKAKAYEDLRKTLARAPWTKPDAKVQRGIDFENKVYDILGGIKRRVESEEEQKALDYFCKELVGAEIQRSGKKIVNIDGEVFCLYVKMDAYFPTVRIDDIKTTGSYKPNKYLSGFQHLLYCYVMNETRFRYLVQPFDEQGKFLEPVIEYWELPTYKPQTPYENAHSPAPYNLSEVVFDKVREIRTFIREYTELNTLFETVYSK